MVIPDVCEHDNDDNGDYRDDKVKGGEILVEEAG